jgi:hypothetical protein
MCFITGGGGGVFISSLMCMYFPVFMHWPFGMKIVCDITVDAWKIYLSSVMEIN